MKKYDVFISYRRDGGYDTAKHLNDLLVRDGYRVSFDIDTLRSGDFDIQLLERIDQCKDFILIVDQHAFDRTLDSAFNPKKDWLRCELAYALKKHKNIVPVFLAGVKGFPEGLPSDVAGVTKKNGPEYNRYYFNDFYKKLKTAFLTSRPQKKTRKYEDYVTNWNLDNVIWMPTAKPDVSSIKFQKLHYRKVRFYNDTIAQENKAVGGCLSVYLGTYKDFINRYGE